MASDEIVEKGDSIIETGPLFDPNARVRDMSITELRIVYRQEEHYFLWLRGFTYAEIKQITGYHRATIWEDLKVMRDNQIIDGTQEEIIRNEALMNLMFDRAIALRMADKHPRQAAKFLAQAISIDKLILTRYTQPRNESNQSVTKMEKQLTWLIDYMIEKMGPDVMADFEEWWRAKEAADRVSRTSKQK